LPGTFPLRDSGAKTFFSFRWVLLVITTGSFGLGMIEPLLPLDLEKRFGLNSAGIGLLFGAFSLFLALAQPLFGALSDRLGRKPPLIGGLLGTAVVVPWLARTTKRTGFD